MLPVTWSRAEKARIGRPPFALAAGAVRLGRGAPCQSNASRARRVSGTRAGATRRRDASGGPDDATGRTASRLSGADRRDAVDKDGRVPRRGPVEARRAARQVGTHVERAHRKGGEVDHAEVGGVPGPQLTAAGDPEEPGGTARKAF